jgi:methionyl-tRNA formyltransferase
MKRDLRIVFMGTPEFAVDSLDTIVNSDYDLAAVVTAPDRPAGRGKKVKSSAVKDYAVGKGLRVLQPEKLRDESFIRELGALNANLFVVVAFRMLPRIVWAMPEFGSFNLHASLLPDYRGAAPINWAIIKGEKETGLTTFFLNENIDTGEIIFQEKMGIGPEETYGELHDRLKKAGAQLVLKTLNAIEQGNAKTKSQEPIVQETAQINPAPKIQKVDAKINWNDDVLNIYNLIRGLCPSPAANTELLSPGNDHHLLKVFAANYESLNLDCKPGSIITDGISYLKVCGRDGTVNLKEVQLAGKKRMKINDFLRGFSLDNLWKMDA